MSKNKKIINLIIGCLMCIAVYTNPSKADVSSKFINGICEHLIPKESESLLSTKELKDVYISICALRFLPSLSSSSKSKQVFEYYNLIFFTYVYNSSRYESLGVIVFGKVFLLHDFDEKGY